MSKELRQELKRILLNNGFEIKQGQDDLTDYVYAAAIEIYKAGYVAGGDAVYKSVANMMFKQVKNKCLQPIQQD